MRLEREPTAGNERLTAAVRAILLVLLAVEGVTILSIRQLLSWHVVVGLLLIPPVLLKLASTGYRFVRYYAGDRDYVAKGPPHLIMRLLAPLLVVSTLTVLGSGVLLLALGPHRHRDLLLGLHQATAHLRQRPGSWRARCSPARRWPSGRIRWPGPGCTAHTTGTASRLRAT